MSLAVLLGIQSTTLVKLSAPSHEIKTLGNLINHIIIGRKATCRVGTWLPVDMALAAANYVTDISRREDLFLLRPWPHTLLLSLAPIMFEKAKVRAFLSGKLLRCWLH
jgi:hypothetical protein